MGAGTPDVSGLLLQDFYLSQKIDSLSFIIVETVQRLNKLPQNSTFGFLSKGIESLVFGRLSEHVVGMSER